VASSEHNKLNADDDAASSAAAQSLIGGRYNWVTSDVLDPSGDGPMMPSSNQVAEPR
jgi:hypothetical protein